MACNKDFDWTEILAENNFSNIEKYGYVPRISGYTNFYTANYNNEKVFIKCGNGNLYAKREYDLNNMLYSKSSGHFVKGITYQNIGRKMFVATKYIDGNTLDKIQLDELNDSQINNTFYSIVKIGLILYKNKLIFRDFNEKNLIVEKDGNVRLFDPQYLIGKEYSEPEINLIHLKKLRGTNKGLRPYPYVWDDMYAIYKILKKFPKKRIRNYNKKMKIVKYLINKNRYYFFDNKIPVSSYQNMKIAIFYKLCNELLKPFRKIL